MCGISFLFATKSQAASLIYGMNQAIRHRGPDDEGYLVFTSILAPPQTFGGDDTPSDAYQSESRYAPTTHIDTLANSPISLSLAHRRLSIVDTSPMGHQPMCSVDQRYWIVYNGEIYNHLELRAELEGLGHVFESHSDTEVLLAAFSRWGTKCVDRLNGMFAFLIYDNILGTIFLARDRFGIKPLYYWISEHGIAVASEIKQFTVLPGWVAQLNHQRTYDFLTWGVSDHTDETMFAGVFQLRGGQFLELNLGDIAAGRIAYSAGSRLPCQTWYELKPTPFSGSIDAASGRFLELFSDSVRLQLRADVPVGSCLSGGMDSSAIVGVVNKLLRAEGASSLQRTFSACSNISEFDERKWIEIVVDATGVEASYTYPEVSQLFADSESIVWHQDEPFGSTSIYAQWSVFQLAARNNIKVMLDGQGADEQLGGYHSFFGPRLSSLFRSLRWTALAREASAIKRIHGYSFWKSVEYVGANLLPERVRDLLRRTRGRSHASPSWLSDKHLTFRTENPLHVAGATDAGSIQSLSMTQLTSGSLQMLLHWEDRDSMAHSIESRVPFLDHRLVEFVLGLPDDFKVSDGITKRVLRISMKEILPEEISGRMDKLGFVTPEESWLRRDAPDTFREKLEEAITVCGGLLRPAETRTLLEDMITGKLPFDFLPWRLISFGQWIKAFSVRL